MTFSSYELVPTDVQQALLKAYDEQNSREVLPPTWKNKRVSPLGINAPQYTLTSRKPREGLPVSI